MTGPTPPGHGAPVGAHSPGRVNLIGDHTDYNQGVALPMAVDLGTTVTFTADGGTRIVLTSSHDPHPADVDVHLSLDPRLLGALEPPWARYVAAVASVVRPPSGGHGTVVTTLPVGAGLSSSAALEVALALVLGCEAEPVTLARACQHAEQAATGVPTGIMDQLVVSAAQEGYALLIDFTDLSMEPVVVPEDAEIVVVHSGETRSLHGSAYAQRRAECEAAAHRLGPLGHLDQHVAGAIPDALLRRRARHVVSECDRVRLFAAALVAGDLPEAGRLMTASHTSLAQDFEVSTPGLDALVETLVGRPGVYGARLTGAGFGGCVVALAAPGAIDIDGFTTPAWRVRAARGAHLIDAS
ncbi:MAG: galactokinase family protein [Acidimicrobiales bacterium]|jgi:galactokinase